MLNEVSIEIIRKCPNYCVHCSSMSDANSSEILDYDRFVSVVTDAANLGAKTICLSGGEPFLHPKIVDMIEFIQSLGMASYVYTSGIVFNTQKVRCTLDNDILHSIAGKVTKLIFNIEAGTESTYDLIMGTSGCFEKLKQSLKKANDFAILTEAHFVPMKMNVHEVESAIELCERFNVSKISFLRLVLHGRAQQNEHYISLTRDEFLQLQARLNDLQKKSKINIRIGVPLSSEVTCHKCEAANGKLNIKYDGNVFPCEVFKNNRISHSLKGLMPESIYEKSLMSIYNDSQYLQYVRKLSQEYFNEIHCETCVGQYLISSEEDRLV